MQDKTIAWSTAVSKDWIDYNGHMGDWAYVYAFSLANDKDMETVGIGEDYRRRSGCTMYTMTSVIHYHRELKLGAPIEITAYLADLDNKRVHYWMELFDVNGDLAAAYETLLMHVKQTPERVFSTEFPEDIYERLVARQEKDSDLPRPELLGASVGIRRKV